MLIVQRSTLIKWTGGRILKGLNEVMDNEVNAIRDIETRRLQNKDDVNNIQENKSNTYPNVFDGTTNDRIGTSEFASASPRCTNTPDSIVEELTVRNLNHGKSEIVGGSKSVPGVWEDSEASFFSQFLDKRRDHSQSQSQSQSQRQGQSQNENENDTTNNAPRDEKLLSPGGIRTKILSKSGFSEYFVKNTLQGKGVTFKGPARDKVNVQIDGQTDSRDTSIPVPEPKLGVSPNNEGLSLRKWLNDSSNKVDKSKSLNIFKKILDIVDSSHSRGVALQDLRPSFFSLLPSNDVLYFANKELVESRHSDNRDGKKRKYNSFGMRAQFPNRSGSDHGRSSRDFGYGFNEDNVVSGGDLLERQWYVSPEELKEAGPTLASNIYSLGVFLFELLGSFGSSKEHAVAMMNLRQRILPPSFLSENAKEAGYCLWLLHPEAHARPTTRDILKSKIVSEIEEISTEKLLSSIAREDIESELLLHFLLSVKEEKKKYTTKLFNDINCIESDITEIESRRGNNVTFDTNTTSSSSNILKSNLNHLESAYFSARSNIEVSESETTGISDRVGNFFNGLCKYARFSKFEVRGNLRNGDFSSSANVISSLGFDRDEDYFATAGVSKKIKVYDFQMLLDDSVDIHYPAVEMPNKSKLTCICWNSYIKNYLASTDYDGVVKLWDVGIGQAVSHRLEHERRAWSVDFSRVDPTKLASGGDDCYVKLWSINEKNSLSTIRSTANVCCVQFSPYSANLLSFGSSDYRTYCYDIRNVSSPLCILAGHDRAVSYVKFLDSETIISASTDNTLKLWDLNKTSFGTLSTNSCVLTYKGHTNEKNFVGLSVADGYIACGSETNEVYAYYRSLPMPITSHKFGSIDPISGKETDHANNQFVSSVCWRQKSDMVIAANSSGCLKVLQMT
ncbi:protein SPA1-RELATED 2-like [Rutidosis leptorrhynchoides]|uniref:protein SPA1-RELATED 2-like n=1 Tax=Rutidosis leptorrhynchoides TaxID=125765 RepID=UPI003A991E0E